MPNKNVAMTAAQKRKITNEKRINKHNDVLNKKGINSSITYKGKNYTPKQLARLNDKNFKKVIKAYDQKQRVEEVRRYAEFQGVDKKDLKKYRTWKSVSAFAESEPVYKAKEFLGVAWYDQPHDDKNLRGALLEARQMSKQELKEQIERMYQEGSTSDSDGFQGVFSFHVAPTESICIKEINSAAERGYGVSLMPTKNKEHYQKKLINVKNADVNTLAISNEFTERGILELMYVTMCRTSHTYQVEFYELMETYLYHNIPELHGKIFD